jgi:hypothetical protein
LPCHLFFAIYPAGREAEFTPGFPFKARPAVIKPPTGAGRSFRSNDDRRPSKFIVLADNMKSAINVAWEHGGTDFRLRFDKSTGQAEQMKEGALRVL